MPVPSIERDDAAEQGARRRHQDGRKRILTLPFLSNG
jgi:hypothetical protein